MFPLSPHVSMEVLCMHSDLNVSFIYLLLKNDDCGACVPMSMIIPMSSHKRELFKSLIYSAAVSQICFEEGDLSCVCL